MYGYDPGSSSSYIFNYYIILSKRHVFLQKYEHNMITQSLPLSRAGKRKTVNSKINRILKRSERYVFIFMEALARTYLV